MFLPHVNLGPVWSPVTGYHDCHTFECHVIIKKLQNIWTGVAVSKVMAYFSFSSMFSRSEEVPVCRSSLPYYTVSSASDSEKDEIWRHPLIRKHWWLVKINVDLFLFVL